MKHENTPEPQNRTISLSDPQPDADGGVRLIRGELKTVLMRLCVMAVVTFMAAEAMAVGSVDVSGVKIGRDEIHIVFACTGDSSDGSVPDKTIPSNWLKVLKGSNYSLIDVKAMRTPGGTAPDAADVQVLESSLVISEDADITPTVPRDILLGAGADLIHATDATAIGPAMPIYEQVSGNLALRVVNQDTASANYTVVFVFSK